MLVQRYNRDKSYRGATGSRLCCSNPSATCADTNPYAFPLPQPCSHPNAYFHPNTHRYPYPHPNTHRDSKTDSHTHAQGPVSHGCSTDAHAYSYRPWGVDSFHIQSGRQRRDIQDEA